MQVTIRATGPVAADEVWERYAVPARWAGWAPQIDSVETAAPRIVPGARGRVHGPLGVGVTFLVTDVDEAARTWAWDVELGPVRLHLRHGVVDRRGAGTLTWLATRGAGPVLAAYLPVARVALHLLVHRADVPG